MEDITYEFDLERSSYVKKRRELRKSVQVPTISDAKSTLGPALTDVLCKQCDCALRADFGLTPPLSGALGELWTSPSDLLIGKVCLKPPLTTKHIQALTHEGIVGIGTQIEKKYWNEMEIEKEKALKEQKEQMENEFEKRMSYQIRQVMNEEQERCRLDIESLTTQFEITMKEQIAELENILRVEMDYALLYKEQELSEKWSRKLEDEVQKTVKEMTAAFLDDLKRQETLLRENFSHDMRKMEIKNKHMIELEKKNCRSTMEQIRHSLQCKSITNMMYVLCKERQKCKTEKLIIETKYENILSEKENLIEQKDKEIETLKKERDDKINELCLRDLCLEQIIRQFQKFINFALRAAPKQAEFLLSLEKLLTFGLTDAVVSSEFNNVEPAEVAQSWKSDEESSESSARSLKAPDNHDCFKEIDFEENLERDSAYLLPGLYYKNNMYIREDFRNMCSRGIDISSSNLLWNKDVEYFMDVLKQSVDSPPMERRSTLSQRKRLKSSEAQKSSTMSNVRFTVQLMDSEEGFRTLSSTSDSEAESKDKFKCPLDEVELHRMKDKKLEISSKSNLLAVCSSLELLRNKLSCITKKYETKQCIDDYVEIYEPQASEEFIVADEIMLKEPSLPQLVPQHVRTSTVPDAFIENRESVISLKDQVQINPSSKHKMNRLPSKSSEEPIVEQIDDEAIPVISSSSKLLAVVDSLTLLKEKTGSKIGLNESKLRASYISNNTRVSFYDKPVVCLPINKDRKPTKSKRQKTEDKKTPTSEDKQTPTHAIVNQNTCEIVGYENTMEHLQTQEEFAVDRMHSFLKLIKGHPNLIKTFTACTR